MVRISRKHNLRIGTSIGQNSFPVYYTLDQKYKRETHLTSKAGILLEGNIFYFGTSLLNLPITKWDNSLNKNIISVQSGLKLILKENIITPSLQLIKYQTVNNLLYNLKYERKWLELNVGYNNYEEILTGLGVEFNKINFRYTYNYSISKLLFMLNNKHTFQLTYTMKSRCKAGSINCFFN